MLFRSLILLALLLPGTAGAGAWPRGKGTVFLALSAETDSEPSRRAATGGLYAEIGLSPRLTLGGQADRNAGGELFLRHSIALPRGHVLGFSFGAGRTASTITRSFTFSGAHWAKTFSLRGLPGWITLDTRLAFGVTSQIDHGKADLLAGLSLGPRWKVMLALESYRDFGGTTANVVPSLARRIAPGTHLQLRAITPVAGGGAARGGLSLWVEF